MRTLALILLYVFAQVLLAAACSCWRGMQQLLLQRRAL